MSNEVQLTKNAADVAIAFALSQVGKPYVWGANGPNAYDCSSLMQQSYLKAGIKIPRTTPAQIYWCKVHPSRAALQPGDLVAPTTGHVQMYLGGGRVVHAPHKNAFVEVVPLSGFWKAGRVTATPGTPVIGSISNSGATATDPASFSNIGCMWPILISLGAILECSHHWGLT